MADRKIQQILDKSSKVKTGQLTLLQKGTIKKTKNYYAVLSSTSRSGLARLELYENVEHSLSLQPSFMVLGQDVIKVERTVYKGKQDAILISTKEHHYIFLSESAALEWVTSLQNTLLGAASDVRHAPVHVTKENDVYQSCDEILPKITEFIVNIAEDAQERLGYKGKVRLLVDGGHIIVSSLSGVKIAEWCISHIRRFGWDETTFYMEAGRKSTVGQGSFDFITDQANIIYAAVEKARGVKERKDEAGPTSKIRPYLPLPPPPASKVPLETYGYTGDVYDVIDVPPEADIPLKGVQEKGQVPIPPLPHEVTYSTPMLVTDAWKTNGLDDDSEMYTNLSYGAPVSLEKSKEQLGEHYWQGSIPPQPKEPVYSAVDVSKKKKKGKSVSK